MLKKVLSYLVATIIWISVLEWGSRFVIDRYGDPLLKSYRILRQDAKLGWKLRSGLDLKFYDGKLTTNSDGFRAAEGLDKNQKISIMTLGPSSAFGWGVGDQETYTHHVSQWLNDKKSDPSPPFNASQVGYSSLQGLWLFEDLKPMNFKPQVVVVAYGVNDIDRFRFFFSSAKSDQDELSATKSVEAYNFLSQSSFFNLVAYVAKKKLGNLNCDWMTKIPVQRVGIDKSMDALATIIRSYQESGVTVVAINTPHRYEDKFQNYDGEAEKKIQHMRQKSFSSREAFVENIKKIVKNHPHQTLGYYELMRVAAEKGDCQGAEDFLDKARLNEPRRIVFEINRFNKALASLSKEIQTPLIDAHRLLKQDQKMFVDPIHPSAVGHKLIAESVIRQLSSIKGDE